MKCYYHPDRDAVGVCVKCGKGLCSSCAVNLDGKVYCEQDAEAEEDLAELTFGLSTNKVAAIVVAIILLAVFFIAPVVPYSQSAFFVTAHAWVSPSYAVFHCGMVLNPSTQFGGSQGMYWTCNGS